MNLDDLNTLHTLDELESRNDLTNRPNLERLHVLDDLQELDGGKGKADPPPVKMEIKDGNRRFNAACSCHSVPSVCFRLYRFQQVPRLTVQQEAQPPKHFPGKRLFVPELLHDPLTENLFLPDSICRITLFFQRGENVNFVFYHAFSLLNYQLVIVLYREDTHKTSVQNRQFIHTKFVYFENRHTHKKDVYYTHRGGQRNPGSTLKS